MLVVKQAKKQKKKEPSKNRSAGCKSLVEYKKTAPDQTRPTPRTGGQPERERKDVSPSHAHRSLLPFPSIHLVLTHSQPFPLITSGSTSTFIPCSLHFHNIPSVVLLLLPTTSRSAKGSAESYLIPAPPIPPAPGPPIPCNRLAS